MKKPSRKHLLAVLDELQGLIGRAQADYDNDRAPNRADLMHATLSRAFDLCVAARSWDAPLAPTMRDRLVADFAADLPDVGAKEGR